MGKGAKKLSLATRLTANNVLSMRKGVAPAGLETSTLIG